MFFIYFLLFICAFLLSFALFVPSVRLSASLGAIDMPGQRKTHTLPTPRAGGFSFFISFELLLLASDLPIGTKIPLAISSCTVWLVGLLDDALELSPIRKLTGQLLAASVYIFMSDARSVLSGMLTLLWIVYLTNAINLCDGLNGLAGGLCASQTVCLGALAAIFNNYAVALCCIILLGSILGFLPNNFPRARIFMGDCGALFLGFTMGALSSKLVFESKSPLCLIACLLIFRIPTYDTNFSIIRRLIRGKNPFKADKGHFHHRLLAVGFTKECATLALVTASLFFGLLGIVLVSL